MTVSDLGKSITVEITSSVETGAVLSSGTSAVVKKTASAPAAPVLSSKTYNSVTLTAVTGYEYSKDGTTWQSSVSFTGLSDNTGYTFYQRVAETGDTYASPSSPGLSVTTDVAPPNALTGTAVIDIMSPKIGDTLTGSLSLGNNTGTLSYQWKADGVNIGTGSTYTVTVSDLGKSIAVEITSSAEVGIVSSAGTSPVVKKTASVPAAPVLLSKTYDSVTLTAVAGYEYSMDGTAWQSSAAFTGLSDNTGYTFFQRVAETGDTYASASSPALNVTTDAAGEDVPAADGGSMMLILAAVAIAGMAAAALVYVFLIRPRP